MGKRHLSAILDFCTLQMVSMRKQSESTKKVLRSVRKLETKWVKEHACLTSESYMLFSDSGTNPTVISIKD